MSWKKVKTGILLTIFRGTSTQLQVFVTRKMSERDLRRYFKPGDWVISEVRYSGKPYADDAIFMDLDGVDAWITYDGDTSRDGRPETYVTTDCFENQFYMPLEWKPGEHRLLGLTRWEVRSE